MVPSLRRRFAGRRVCDHSALVLAPAKLSLATGTGQACRCPADLPPPSTKSWCTNPLQGELFSTAYFDGLAAEVDEALQEAGVVAGRRVVLREVECRAARLVGLAVSCMP